MVKPGHVSCDFDILNIGDNDLENFKNIFGKVAKNLKLNYEIQTLGKMAGGGATEPTNLSSTFPYKYFETTIDSFFNNKLKLNEERKGVYSSLFGDVPKPVAVGNNMVTQDAVAHTVNNVKNDIIEKHETPVDQNSEGILDKAMQVKDNIIEKVKEYVNFIREDDDPVQLKPAVVENLQSDKYESPIEKLKHEEPVDSTGVDYDSDNEAVIKVKILKVRLLVERKNEPEGLLMARLIKGS